LIATAKTIPGHQWHPVEKYWRFPNTDGTLEGILEASHGCKILIDPALQDAVPDYKNTTSHPGSGKNRATIDRGASGNLKITFFTDTIKRGETLWRKR
jgi:hypothetical protein